MTDPAAYTSCVQGSSTTRRTDLCVADETVMSSTTFVVMT